LSSGPAQGPYTPFAGPGVSNPRSQVANNEAVEPLTSGLTRPGSGQVTGGGTGGRGVGISRKL